MYDRIFQKDKAAIDFSSNPVSALGSGRRPRLTGTYASDLTSVLGAILCSNHSLRHGGSHTLSRRSVHAFCPTKVIAAITYQDCDALGAVPDNEAALNGHIDTFKITHQIALRLQASLDGSGEVGG